MCRRYLGRSVARAVGAQRESALYFDEMGASRVPVGFGRDGQPVYVNFEFLDGTRGAHVSISGVSGIATKTSFAMFLLHSIINCGVLAGEAHNTKVLIFSVKGEDLLFLDYANSRLTASQEARYGALGLPAAPFGNVRVFAPPRRGDPAGTPDVSARDRAVSPFFWTLAEFCARGAAAVRVRRRRGRAGPVHDADRPGRRAAAPGRGPGRG